MIGVRLAASWLLLSACTLACAHSGGTIGFATVTVDASTVRYSLALARASIPPELALQMGLDQPGTEPDYRPLLGTVERQVQVHADGRPCTGSKGEVIPPAKPGRSTLITIDFQCPGAAERLTLRDDLFDVLGSDYHTVAHMQWARGSRQLEFEPQAREALVDLTRAGPDSSGWFGHGGKHVLLGVDHLLFLLALMLRHRRAQSLLGLTAAFTLAHTSTLALAVLASVTLADWLVEAIIGAAIAYLAAEALFLKRHGSQALMVSIFIGLVHGLSQTLRGLGLPAEGLAWPLLSFGLGLEAAQVLVIAAVLPILRWWRHLHWKARTLT